MTNTINEPVQINDTLNVTGDVKVNTNKLTIDAPTGNIVSAGTLTTANITRYLFVNPSAMMLDTGANQDPDESSSNNAPALSFNDSENNIVRFAFPVPETYNAGTNITIEVLWTSTVTTGNVEWEIDWASIPVDGTENAGSDGTDAYIDAAPGTTGFALSTGGNLAITSATITAGDIVTVKLNRDAQVGNADDTLAGAALLLGVRINYTSTR